MSPNDAVQLIRDLGFPIFVCLWFMLRLEKKLDAIVAAMRARTALLNADDGVQAIDEAVETSKVIATNAAVHRAPPPLPAPDSTPVDQPAAASKKGG